MKFKTINEQFIAFDFGCHERPVEFTLIFKARDAQIERGYFFIQNLDAIFDSLQIGAQTRQLFVDRRCAVMKSSSLSATGTRTSARELGVDNVQLHDQARCGVGQSGGVDRHLLHRCRGFVPQFGFGQLRCGSQSFGFKDLVFGCS